MAVFADRRCSAPGVERVFLWLFFTHQTGPEAVAKRDHKIENKILVLCVIQRVHRGLPFPARDCDRSGGKVKTVGANKPELHVCKEADTVYPLF
jgi:hypothetical protein